MFSKVKKILFANLLLIGVFATAHFALAAGVDVGLGFGAGTGLGTADPRAIAANVIRIALAFLAIIAVGLMVYGGFLWMTAAGNEDQVDRAKKLLVSAIIGLVIILSAFGIATFVLSRLLTVTGVATTGTGSGGGVIPPGSGGLGTPCDDNTLTPMCEPSTTICDALANLYCSPASCTCRLGGGVGASCDSDDALAGCQADGGMCMPGLFCDNSTCSCAAGTGVGVSCDLDLGAPGCQMSTTTCSNYLTCDPTAADPCTCQDWPVIQWISPVGGFCSDEPDKACSKDSDCTLSATSNCNKSLPMTAYGNIVTIGGIYFGDTPGTVYFWDGSGFTLAGVSPSTLNPNCDSNWKDNQIIVVVPNGAVSGPVRVVRNDLLSDDTNNKQGPVVSDLYINNIKKPGLCKIVPDKGDLDTPITYYGINFSAGANAKFGNYSSSISGKNPTFTSVLQVGADVPSISTGPTTTFVAGPSGDLSNYLRFVKVGVVNSGPYIVSFEPITGAPGQYVTINGSGFGTSRGKSAIYFGDNTGFPADYSFPEVCADSVWNDKQIIVKVPTSATDGNFPLTIDLGNGKVIDTSTLSPAVFQVNRSLPLLPSLCKIYPPLGDAGTLVSLWGEYFDTKNVLSQVEFANKKTVTGAGITFWAQDEDIKSGVKPDRIDTTVPTDSNTGLVKVVKGATALAGNGLNFKIGSCLEAEKPNDACNPGVCCAAGTFKAGRCAGIVDKCFMDVPSSVYEWDFNTGDGLTANSGRATTSSCMERSLLEDMCDVTVCPNSAGECSPYTNVLESGLSNAGSCVFSCAKVGPCKKAGDCTYNAAIDRCVAAPGFVCSMPIKVKDVYNNDVDASCQEYQGQSRRVIYIDKNTACPKNWTKTNIGDASTILACVDLGSSCTICGGDFACVGSVAGGPSGACAATKDICPPDATCQADNKCKKTAVDECQCCCRKANLNQDCCAGLTCEGTCGSDVGKAKPTTYGSCSGCRADANNDGSISGAEQTVSDKNCNCANSFGKFCDVNADPNGDGKPEGVCNDCAALASDSSCTDHSTSCCVDKTKEKICTGLRFGTDVDQVFTPLIDNGVSYCGYFSCQNNNSSCNGLAETGPFLKAMEATTTAGVMTPAVPAVKYFRTKTDCTKTCSKPALAGLGCFDKVTKACDASICGSPLECLIDLGGSSPATDCGICCCSPSNDQCGSIGSNPNMRCQPDLGPCSGSNRGLCCGCAFNADCVAAGSQPTEVGCGADNCCRARPSVTATNPLDNQTKVCTNAEIQATFNEKMDPATFSGNVIVVGEYVTACPQGTVFLASGDDGWQKKSALAKTWDKISGQTKILVKKIFRPNALASAPPLIFMNYCAIPGTTDFEHVDSDTGPTILKFKPTNLLNASRKYFVVVKGDLALDNSAGVKNFWGIGMNIPTGVPFVDNRVDNSSKFNGIAYPASHIWSFTTRPDQGGNKGVCDIDTVKIVPSSYLFSKNANDLNENDSASTSKTFDSVRDSDKKFTAKALSLEGETLVSAPGYAWEWNWAVDDAKVASIVNDAINHPFSDKYTAQLIRASDKITDQRTKARAVVRLTDKTLSSAGDGKEAISDIFVFVCANPWPGIDAVSGNWSPWMDDPYGMNCVAGSGSCLDMRYEMYYCRDSGAAGTADDLPVLSTSTSRGSNGSVLKESYFFRQAAPSVEGSSLQLMPVPRGGEVELKWNEVKDPLGLQTVSKYKIYYGSKSGAPYPSSIEVPVAQAPYISGNSPVLIQNLDKNKDYYFAITAVYGNGQESTYSNEEQIQPKDIQAPAKPIGVLSESPLKMFPIHISYTDSGLNKDPEKRESFSVSFSVDDSANEVLKYVENFKLNYGTSPGIYSSSTVVSARKALMEGAKTVFNNNFATGTTYYFSASSLKPDNSLLEGAGEISLIFNEDGSSKIEDFGAVKSTSSLFIPIPSGTMTVEWKPNTDDTVKYFLYVGTNHASYGKKIEILGRDADQGKAKKEYSTTFDNTQGQFFIAVSAVDAAGNESEKSDETISIPSKSAYTFRNALTNVGFEEGALGGVPANWSGWAQPKTTIGISSATSFSGSRSLRLFQEAKVPYPGICGQPLIDRLAPAYNAYPYSFSFVNKSGSNYCVFPKEIGCNNNEDCEAIEGGELPWPNSNRVMWGKVVYNVSDLKWVIGEDYLLAFYYKGRLRSGTSPILGYDLGWPPNCHGLFNGGCSDYGPNWHVCPNDSGACCEMPAQESCYDYVVMPGISAGDYNNGPYNGWYLYFETFTYTEGLSRLYDWAGKKRNEVGMSIGYNNTEDGTDFYIDDFIVAQRVKE